MSLSVCVLVALVIQHAKRMLCIMLSSVTSLAAPYFQHYLISGTIFVKQDVEHKLCVFWFSLQIVSETFLTLRIIQRDVVINMETSSRKVPVILVGFFDGFSKKKVKYQISSKSVQL